MRNSRIVVALFGLLACSVAAACSGKEHPPYVDPDEGKPGFGGAPGEAPDNPDITAGGVPGEFQGTPDLPDPGADLGNGNFARGQIYIVGQLRDPLDAGWAVAHLTTPDNFITGFPSSELDIQYYGPFRTFAFTDSKLLYGSSTIDWDGSGRTFVVDGSGTGALTEPYPEAPADNDPVLETPHCPNDVQGIVTSPGGRMIYRCGAFDWYEGDDLVLQHPDVFLLTDEGTAMYHDALPMNVVQLGGEEGHAVDVVYMSGARVVGSKFRATALRSDEAYELIEIATDGSYKSLGIYPAGSDDVIRSSALDTEDRLYQLGGPNNFPPFQLKRFTRGGKIETLLKVGESAVEPILLMSP